MKTIQLSSGRETMVDDADFAALGQLKWSFGCDGYAYRSVRDESGKKRSVFMHRVILCAPHGLQVDHRNSNKLDNQRSNLRLCTGSQNKCNVGLRSVNTTGYKGVTFHKARGQFRAAIRVPGKRFYMGPFATAEEAAEAYRAAAMEKHGEFARIA